MLVVLVHSRDWLATAGLDLQGWAQINEVLAGLRMPLFFAISGLLGAKWVAARWAALLPGKITVLVWVYLAWQPIGLAAALIADRFTGGHQGPLHLLLALAATVVRPRSELWFLWALAAYFALGRLTTRVPVMVQLLVAGSVSAVWLSSLVPVGNLGWNGVPKYYLFFLLGIHHRQLLIRIAGLSHRARLFPAALLIGWALVATATSWYGAERYVGVGLATRLLGLAAGTALAATLAGSGLLRHLGARTLPIYLAHTPAIIVLAWLLHPYRAAGWAHLLTPVLPIVITALVVPLTLVLYVGAGRTWARLLYAPPSGVTTVVRRICTRPAAAPARRREQGPSRPDAVPRPGRRPERALATGQDS